MRSPLLLRTNLIIIVKSNYSNWYAIIEKAIIVNVSEYKTIR